MEYTIRSSVEYIKNGEVNKEVTSKIEKYLKYILILFAIIQVVGIFEIEFVVEHFPSAKWIGIIGILLCSLLTCFCYYKLSFVEEDFETYSKLLVVVTLIDTAVNGIQVSEGISTLIKLVIAIVGIFGIRYKCMSFASLLLRHNTELYINWTNIWKWHKWVYLTMIASIVLVFLPWVMIVLFWGSTIGLFVVQVLEIWYVYKTYTYFKELSMDKCTNS